MFCDEVTVHFTAGRGGNGCIAFRREKYVPRGGPIGGDGGRGGSIFLQADENINTLAEFNTKKMFRAEEGEQGLGKGMGGSDAPDLFLPVPVGTMIFKVAPTLASLGRRVNEVASLRLGLNEKKKNLLGDLRNHGDKFLVARGGKGGFGNAHFKSSTRQAPRFAELGEPGEERTYMLELKLVADVGIIGLPSVGKSTLLSRISNARPKIADYPFTTLVPNLGLVTLKPFGGSLQQNFLACDLPGLIEGAHKGKGLGIQFLKHVARNRILVHLLDVNSQNPAEDYRTIQKEMKMFDKNLSQKPQIMAFNKIDTIDKAALKKIVADFKKKTRVKAKIFMISCIAGEGLKELIFEIWRALEKEKEKEYRSHPPSEKTDSFKIFRPHLDLPESARTFTIEALRKGKKKNTFRVEGPRIEQIVVMTDFNNPEAVARVYDVLERTGVVRELRKMGAKFGDEIKIGEKAVVYRWE